MPAIAPLAILDPLDLPLPVHDDSRISKISGGFDVEKHYIDLRSKFKLYDDLRSSDDEMSESQAEKIVRVGVDQFGKERKMKIT
ncbi:hypothetical protein ACEPAI_4164 [Sanghuangporus weigelae]